MSSNAVLDKLREAHALSRDALGDSHALTIGIAELLFVHLVDRGLAPGQIDSAHDTMIERIMGGTGA